MHPKGFKAIEQRLARILLMLASLGKEGRAEPIIANVSQETLAKMVGIPSSQVSVSMEKFCKLGFVEYNDSGLHIHSSLRNVVVHD
jgi:CRP/FNR family transcriptional regulator, cyclic AMP receptor protein